MCKLLLFLITLVLVAGYLVYPYFKPQSLLEAKQATIVAVRPVPLVTHVGWVN